MQNNLILSYMIVVTVLLSLVSCAEIEPEPVKVSEGHIKVAEPNDLLSSAIPELLTPAPILPKTDVTIQSEFYTVVVNEVPVKELLFALARDTGINVDIHPAIEGIVTINAVDQTLAEILKRITHQVNMRYIFEDNYLTITTNTPYLKIYAVDYVNLSRETTSRNTIATQISSTSGGGQSGGGQSGGNNSITGISSVSSNQFWNTLLNNLKAILGDGQGANNQNVIANPESGIIAIRATEMQHKTIQNFIDQILSSAKRQVLIQATLASVTLNREYQAGIDWSLLATKAGITVTSNTLGVVPSGTLSSFVLSYEEPNQNLNEQFSSTIRLLDEYGDTRILASPQVMVLNNQTALLKSVENVVYFEVDSETTTSGTSGNIQQSVDTNAQIVPVGIVMAVTPQISANGEISLNVRPTISRIVSFKDDPNPQLQIANPVPQIEVSELESVLRLNSGQIGVLGGLMQDEYASNDRGLPKIKDQLGIGSLFKTKSTQNRKTELVIFIRPYVINNPSIKSDLKQYEQFINNN